MTILLALTSLEKTLLALDEKILQKAPQILSGLVVFLVFYLVARGANLLIRRVIKRMDLRKHSVMNLVRQTVYATILTVGTISGLGTMGVDVSALVAGLGLTGFALGFALRDALSNLLAGVMILIYRPFSTGQKITVSGFQGTVTEIDLRYTTLSNDDKTVLIPNSILFTNAITIQK